ncbi:Uncharacterised protein [Candidatus Tiddalikarchaeum anstoanum]|nr:Uncharacterised protein [Candidatus Tiddalikarchaeum anstoanum]
MYFMESKQVILQKNCFKSIEDFIAKKLEGVNVTKNAPLNPGWSSRFFYFTVKDENMVLERENPIYFHVKSADNKDLVGEILNIYECSSCGIVEGVPKSKSYSYDVYYCHDRIIASMPMSGSAGIMHFCSVCGGFVFDDSFFRA